MSETRLIPINAKAGYLEARRLADERGHKLPSNVLHDDYLVRSDGWKKLDRRYYASLAWAREILVYPEKGGIFTEGKDIVDSETGWVLPASYVPKGAVGRTGVGLFIDPQDVKEENSKIIVHPAGRIAVLCPFIQERGEGGRVDEATRVPLMLESGSEVEERWLWRIDGVGVRPIIRSRNYGTCYFLSYGENINAFTKPGDSFGVALEAVFPARDEEKTETSVQKENGVFLSGITREKLDALINDAKTNMFELMGDGFPLDEVLKVSGIRRLLEALKKKE